MDAKGVNIKPSGVFHAAFALTPAAAFIFLHFAAA
jgi:hypothetical protein